MYEKVSITFNLCKSVCDQSHTLFSITGMQLFVRIRLKTAWHCVKPEMFLIKILKKLKTLFHFCHCVYTAQITKPCHNASHVFDPEKM